MSAVAVPETSTTLAISVLGPVAVEGPDGPVDLGTPKQRALVAALALAQGHPVPVDSIVDQLWGESPPPGVSTTLQAYVSGLRKALEPHRQRRAPATVLVTVAPGYALRLPEGASDAARFERTVAEVHRGLDLPLLGPSPVPSDRLLESVARLDEALALWRGTPYAELDDAGATAERARLEELRLVALEDRAKAQLALGRHATTAAELETLTLANPLRERLWALQALALVRSGRQAEALEVLARVRGILDDELGLDPGAELRDLQTRVLRQDEALDWAPPAGGAAAGRPQAVPSQPSLAPAGDSPGTAVLPTHAPGGPPTAAGESGVPLIGRDAELSELTEALARATAGRTAFAVVTGEPGIGKSRLCSELAARAEAWGVRVLVGRCSQDDGAPPLWPWTSVLERLDDGEPLALAVGEGEGPGGDFRAWERIVRSVRDATTAGPVMVVLDDLHWADSATLRVLRLLVETSTDDPMLVVTTWRPRPAPTGDLADVAETLARRHAVRLELTGLDGTAVAGIVSAVTHEAPSPAQAGTLRARTDGNPFFVVEYARLAGGRTDLQQLLAEDHPPTAVQEVLSRRLQRLPERTVAALRVAAVIGREFDVSTLASASGGRLGDEDDLLDLLDPALAAGLLREDGIDRFRFAHALVRDTLYAGLTPSRRARQHAQVAQVLSGSPGRITEEARHWLAAGATHAHRAWRAATAAAAIAVAAHAYREAADLSCAAVDAMRDDPTATPRDRYDVLMQRVVAYRWAAMWPELIATVEEAVEVAEQMGDPLLRAEAAISTTQGALWQSGAHGEVHEAIVAALRRSLDELPTGDSALRCRCMLSLSNELYYATNHQERRALVDEALAMARRLGEPSLVMDACQIAFMSLWAPGTAEERLGYAEESLELARRTGNEQATVVSLCLRAVALGELGRTREMWPAVDRARAEAERLRIVYGLLVIDGLALPWHAMAGDFERCEELLDTLRRITAQASLKHAEDAEAGNLITMALWQGHADRSAAMLASIQDGPLPVTSTVALCLWRSGHEEEATAYLASHDLRLEQIDWFSMLNWCNAAAMSLFARQPDLGATTYQLLAPYAGRACTAGSGLAAGPVDAYLAMAAAAAGETATAGRHGDDALRLAEEWQIPLFARWLGEQRDRFSF